MKYLYEIKIFSIKQNDSFLSKYKDNTKFFKVGIRFSSEDQKPCHWDRRRKTIRNPARVIVELVET